jgi:hypothetical protein
MKDIETHSSFHRPAKRPLSLKRTKAQEIQALADFAIPSMTSGPVLPAVLWAGMG